ncbi:MAG TPA: alpha/beta hydrolase [Steroidobacteraceae bacterium]|jgi:3-oxoadipate enol-lactonase|nr:alpha/beta hydrolase [Steroidobacteraceae bacterium]
MRSIPTNLGRLAVYDTGIPSRTDASSEVLVFWPSVLADHRIYDAQVAALRERYRLILIDGPGHGASGASRGSFSMAHCADAVVQVLEVLEIVQPVVCIGTSWGGLVAGEFALSHPDRTRAVVMLNTPVFKSSALWRDNFVSWGARWLKGTNLYAQGVAESYFMPETRKRETVFMDEFRKHIRRARGTALAQAVRAVLLERDDLASRLQSIAAPTLFVAGTHDPMYLVGDLRRAAAQLPRGRFVELPTAHLAVVDAPTETTRAIVSFLDEL